MIEHEGLSEQALAEQERMTARYQRAIGTTAEFSAYMGLRQAVRKAHGRPANPAERSQRLFFSVAPDTTAPGRAREKIGDWLAGRVDDEDVATVALLLSETVTNAVTHGECSGDGKVDVEGDLAGDALWIAVSNIGPDFDDDPALPPALDPHGRGLYIVAALARAWGRGHAGHHTSVWFEVDRS